MTTEISLGTAVSQPGTIQYGRWDALKFATGTTEFLPVIIAQGSEDGPCIWLTAGIRKVWPHNISEQRTSNDLLF